MKLPAVQLVRIADVLFIGPTIIYAASKTSGALSAALALIGVFTIAYNGVNFYREANKS